jgi:hypothetical protein
MSRDETMIESQKPTESTPTSRDAKSTESKGHQRFVVILVIGVTLILIAVLYNVLFPKAFWQSRELEQNRLKWESQKITHYRISLFLPTRIYYYYDRMPISFEVKDGEVVLMLNALGETVLPGDLWYSAFFSPKTFTIPGLFSYADQIIWEKPPAIGITYDPSLGYPTEIYINPWVEPCCQDFSFKVNSFQVLPP